MAPESFWDDVMTGDSAYETRSDPVEKQPDKCPGCGEPIVEGQHFIRVRLELGTMMPKDWRPVREVEPTVFELDVHNPACFSLWAASNDIMVDVFARFAD